MILAIDIGNTNIVIGCIEGEDILFVERISTDVLKTELEYVVQIDALLDLHEIDKRSISGSIVSSVVPPLNWVIRTAIEKFFGHTPLIVGPGIKTGLNILMDAPATVGSDLIVNAVAGYKCYGAPLIMIDMGTATTVSVLDDKSNYVGGMILPGVRVSLDSLVNRTSQLPRIALEVPSKMIGKNTIECMKGGIIIGQAGAMDGIIDRMWEELGYETKIVATGGLAPAIIPSCRHEIIIDNELTLKGLGFIYEKNTSSK
ncbi:MAG: type III pantothenate kinase [Lachnospiraceae bacterium]|nr:type III pantothenate kinase [Lachnospiraceae bacterium]MBR0148527.1 type III pantothenate kinase [Lachnospiraceae bacterium]